VHQSTQLAIRGLHGKKLKQGQMYYGSGTVEKLADAAALTN